jgi:hypothetical protein
VIGLHPVAQIGGQEHRVVVVNIDEADGHADSTLVLSNLVHAIFNLLTVNMAKSDRLLGIGKACRMSGNRFLPHPSYMGEKRVVVDGWGENAGKVSCGRVEPERSGDRAPGG